LHRLIALLGAGILKNFAESRFSTARTDIMVLTSVEFSIPA